MPNSMRAVAAINGGESNPLESAQTINVIGTMVTPSSSAASRWTVWTSVTRCQPRLIDFARARPAEAPECSASTAWPGCSVGRARLENGVHPRSSSMKWHVQTTATTQEFPVVRVDRLASGNLGFEIERRNVLPSRTMLVGCPHLQFSTTQCGTPALGETSLVPQGRYSYHECFKVVWSGTRHSARALCVTDQITRRPGGDPQKCGSHQN
jgi:hypothetical protein